jgi:ABC-type transport system substrate-binding protein
LRIVDKNPLNWVSIVYNVFEHLMELDKDGTLVPRLATGWRWLDERTLEVTLRQGVKFHNGEVFDADIVKLNWEENTRLRQPFRPGTFLNFKPGSRLEIIDPYTVRFVFPEPDGGALAKISFLHLYMFYHNFALDGGNDWVSEQPELRQLYEQVLGTVDREQQQTLLHQMEQHARDQAYFLFLYNPIKLYAVNKAVEFIPYVTTVLTLDATGVMAEHWSVRKQKASAQER